ncbi:excinuclease ABC subunit UvrA [Myroides odoratimimus]|uniref:excinuclease ABC subunit UvrA n=1 Tax=Myroides odoratimimus TaxID=76832 RepID=UPI00217FC834|nr:excinuclease ABC subunit UvrA [Myroides odoratimimus]MCS7472503.1 excinuclease ABC subunit UvrA [Myroides odoratimimus]MDM1086433.1 excinuclease ABC subunit UvrA [Myroides odoratimimus]
MRKNNEFIILKNVSENNLKNISLKIPKNKITAFVGLSGSGKSSIVFDTIGAEAKRQLYTTFSPYIQNMLPQYGKPNAESIENLSLSVIISQKKISNNSRSTIGTITDIYSYLRLLYSRIGEPFVGNANMFSFNEPKGMCMKCNGIGKRIQINVNKMFDKEKSLNEGAILFPVFAVGTWYWKTFTLSNLFDNNKKLKHYSDKEWNLLLYGSKLPLKFPTQGGDLNSEYEGVIKKFERLYIKRDINYLSKNTRSKVEAFITSGMCDECKGNRLNKKVLGCKIQGYNIAEMSAMEVRELSKVIKSIRNSEVETVTDTILEQLQHLIDIGLDYLTLDRDTSTLSGGESQRVKMVKNLYSSLNDVIYIFDEPSIGLHPRDVTRLNHLLEKIRDKGNTVIVVEHDPDVVKIADHIVEVGPKAGREGGKIVFEGNYQDLLKTDTITGKCFSTTKSIKTNVRTANGYMPLHDVTVHNLKNLSVEIPKGILTVVTGVAGSGKSTLINHAFRKAYPNSIAINQNSIGTSIRSTPATYTGAMDNIRELFAKTNNVSASLFSFNSNGACSNCKGLGVTYLDLAFMEGVLTTCEVCDGKRFRTEALNYKLNGKSISDVLDFTIEEAYAFFNDNEISIKLKSLIDVGLDYLKMGQPVSTLSGGETQRVKLASELHKKGNVYILDEPTTGLHLADGIKLINIMNSLVDAGNTVIVIEHNLDIIKEADWVIDMGLEAGTNGGDIVFQGTLTDLLKDKKSLTAKALR